ncbi:MAG: hypothetical protein UY04_C0057G0004 [Parcubacteria group bacterium GW2011_GWA2_47_7]|nr:MAG: hypothetical protein UY04_C0057G0004 [Parcubacteria group bacterium GW2011_GWA2_47_7]
MEENKIAADEIILDAHVGPDDVIYLTIAGKITNNHLSDFVVWTETVKTLVKEMSKKNSGQISMLTDVRNVLHFESKPVVPLRELLAFNKQYPINSAIVGAKDFTRTLLDALIILTLRNDIHQFSTIDEALAWLKAERAAKHTH